MTRRRAKAARFLLNVMRDEKHDIARRDVRFSLECVAELVTSSFFGASSVRKRPVCVGSPMGEPRPQRPGTNARRHLTPTPHTSRPVAGLDI
jgi:hypothetical protein